MPGSLPYPSSLRLGAEWSGQTSQNSPAKRRIGTKRPWQEGAKNIARLESPGIQRMSELHQALREFDYSHDVKLYISSRPYRNISRWNSVKVRAHRDYEKVEDQLRQKGDTRHYVEEGFKATGIFAQLQTIDPAYTQGLH